MSLYAITDFGSKETSLVDFHPFLLEQFREEYQHINFPHGHSFFQIVLVTHGNGYCEIDGVSHDVIADQVYFIKPGQIHQWHLQHDVQGFVINFTFPFLNINFSGLGQNNETTMFLGANITQVTNICKDPVLIRQVFNLIWKEYQTEQPFTRQALYTLLEYLIILIGRENEIRDQLAQIKYADDLFTKFRKLVDRHYKSRHISKQYAEMLFVTANHLSAHCKQSCGLSAGKCIRNKILLEIKRQLLYTEQTITEIAADFNFASISYLSRFFKKYERISPDEYRKTIGRRLLNLKSDKLSLKRENYLI
ncbi:MAG TPA: helix-turn-helix transcriptional regulator [Mucilaginibacter sp.]|jgi:AraC-like DNA-binding protein